MSEAIAGLPPAPPAGPPRPAATVVLYRPVPPGQQGVEVYWLLRARALRFAGGFYAFPGGKVDREDAGVAVAGAGGEEAAHLAAAARELFEETGVLVAAGAQGLSHAARVEGRRALLAGQVGWGEWLSRHGLGLHAEHFQEAGLWVTPSSLPVRFAARFYLVALPPGEAAESWPGEVAEGGWVRPQEALARWERGEALLHPPQLHAFRVMAAFAGHAQAAAALRAEPGTPDGVPRSIEFQRGIRGLPLATATLPPAAHTTCYLVGHGELLVVDPGTDTEEELARLQETLARLSAEGCRVKAVVLTHHHGDHASGGRAVAERLGVPLWCHRLTAERLGLTPGRLLGEGDRLTLAGTPPMHLTVLHTPGHAPGHVCLVEEQSGAALVGDMVAGVGTILIDPTDGDMGEYLAQLERLRDRPVRTLYPAHGPALPDAPATLQGYIAHRMAREEKVLAAVEAQGSALSDIVARAYDDTPPFLHPLAERSTLAHLLKLEREGRLVRATPERWQRAP